MLLHSWNGHNYYGKPKSPCLGCKTRDIGCHGRCVLYESFKYDMTDFNEKIKSNVQNLKNPRSEAYYKYQSNYTKHGQPLGKYYR